MHITRCYQSTEPFVKLIGHYTHAFELITKYKQRSQHTFSFSDNVNGWSAAASGTFAARCPAICAAPSQGAQLAFPAGLKPAACGFGDRCSIT